MSLFDLAFFVMGIFTIVSALMVVYSNNILHSGYGLLGAFVGVAGLYGLLSFQFIAATQILVYVGGVSVLLLFAMMLTKGFHHVSVTNISTNKVLGSIFGFGFFVLTTILITKFPWGAREGMSSFPDVTVKGIGNALLGEYVVPFELLSVLLLGLLVGTVMLVRRIVR